MDNNKIIQFIETIGKIAQKEYTERSKKILPSVCIAQAALETGWGSSSLMTKANAYFGIKATTSWGGKVYNASTKECYDGKTYTNITACFRAYDSLEESVKDYMNLLTLNVRYAKAVNNPEALSTIQAIKAGGYATSPSYVQNVMAIIDKWNLRKYDNILVSETPKKSVDDIAHEVINGKWGNGNERKLKLESAGYDYSEIQNRVNSLMGANVPVSQPVIDYNAIARDVIRGKYGNGQTRKDALARAGYDYSKVQAEVNKILKG